MIQKIEVRLCRHCERRPALPAEVLCARCQFLPRIRRLYRRSITESEDPRMRYRQRREAELRERARLRLPLFGDPNVG